MRSIDIWICQLFDLKIKISSVCRPFRTGLPCDKNQQKQSFHRVILLPIKITGLNCVCRLFPTKHASVIHAESMLA